MSFGNPSKGIGILFGVIILVMGLFSGTTKVIFTGIFWVILAYLIGED